ncbi:putative ribonuclease H-like domain-containing protein [Tanacetum coccineum]
MLHMDLFGPTNVKSLMKKSYYLVVTDDFSTFSWVFFLATKDETSGILKTFKTDIENQLDHKVKVIRCDNGTEFKNSVMNEINGIKREFSVARTPQQNGVAERRNRTLIEAARTMLVDSKLLTTFWAEVVNTTCYVLNRVLIIKPHYKTPYELIHGRTPLINFMKPFQCPVTILNTRDHLGKFDGKADEGFFIGYSVVSKAIRVFNKRTRIVEETLNIRFLENTPNVTANRPDWIFDVDSLTISMNYVPVVARNQTNSIAGTRDNIVTSQPEKKTEPKQEYILIPICTTDPLISQDPKVSEEDAKEKSTKMDESGTSDKDGKDDQATRSKFERLLQQEKQTKNPNSTNSINTVSTPVNAAGPSFSNNDPSLLVNTAEASNAFEEHLFERFSPFKNAFTLPPVSNMTPMDDTGIFYNAYDDEDVGVEADLNNLETTINASHIPLTRINKDHPKDQIIGDFNSAIQTRRMTKISDKHAMKVIQALEDPSWIEAMQEELLQFQLQKDLLDTERVTLNGPLYPMRFQNLTLEAFSDNETVDKEWEDKMERAATTASSLDETTKAKTVNGERQLQTLVDKKKVIITETSIRSDLHLDNASGIDCLPIATIFEELARMGAKTTVWNEFSSTMASAIICLATNQKFNLSKYIFDAMVKHLEGRVKFLMYLRFVQVFINQQLGNTSHHKEIYVNPSHTKKIFANMMREGKDFSRRVTPLFATIMVQANQEECVDSGIPTASQHTPITIQPSTSKPQKKQSRRKQKKTTAVPHPNDSTADVPNEEFVPTHSNDPLLSGEDRLKLTDLMDMCTKLSERVLDLEHTKAAQAQEITNLKLRVKKRVEYSDDESLGAQEDASNQGRSIEDIDKDAEVSLVDETQGRSNDAKMFDTDTLIGNEVFAENDMIEKDQDVIPKEVSTTAPSTTAVPPPDITEVEITLAQTLAKLKSVKSKVELQEPVQSTATTAPSTIPKAKGITFRDAGESTTRTPTSVSSIRIKDIGKAKMDDPEVTLKKKDQISLDEEMARNLEAQIQAELIEDKRLARKKEEEANIGLIESWDNTQVMMQADFELAQRLQAEEQGEITIEERSRLFVELMNKRKKHFAKLKAEEKRRKPPTKAQKINLMSTYLKNIEVMKSKEGTEESSERTEDELESDKSKKAESSKKKAEGSIKKSIGKKRAGKEQKQESSKRQRMEDDKETDEHEEADEDLNLR